MLPKIKNTVLTLTHFLKQCPGAHRRSDMSSRPAKYPLCGASNAHVVEHIFRPQRGIVCASTVSGRALGGHNSQWTGSPVSTQVRRSSGCEIRPLQKNSRWPAASRRARALGDLATFCTLARSSFFPVAMQRSSSVGSRRIQDRRAGDRLARLVAQDEFLLAAGLARRRRAHLLTNRGFVDHNRTTPLRSVSERRNRVDRAR